MLILGINVLIEGVNSFHQMEFAAEEQPESDRITSQGDITASYAATSNSSVVYATLVINGLTSTESKRVA